MRRANLKPAAKRDLEDIRRYTIREWGSDQADQYLSSLRQKLELLAAHPKMAPALSPTSAIRVATHREHRIFYTVQPEVIEIARILHHAQDFTRAIDRLAERRRASRKHAATRNRGHEPDEPEP